MEILKLKDVVNYVEKNIGIFHSKRLERLKNLELKVILKRKNPYLFKAKNILKTHELVETLMDAYLSSQEETIFGDWLEGLAIFINNKVYNGKKSGITGIDLEFDKENVRYIVTIKSGPNWGNNSQINKMKSDFIKAKKTLRTSNSKLNIRAINGCCYGKCKKTDKGDYFKYCGQDFWEFISGNNNLYIEIIEPLGHKAKEKNDIFLKEYSKTINLFTEEFSKDFCNNGLIDWDKLVKFNSGNK